MVSALSLSVFSFISDVESLSISDLWELDCTEWLMLACVSASSLRSCHNSTTRSYTGRWLQFMLSLDHINRSITAVSLKLYGHIKTAEQRTIIQQYGDWYTGHWWVGYYIWYTTRTQFSVCKSSFPSAGTAVFLFLYMSFSDALQVLCWPVDWLCKLIT